MKQPAHIEALHAYVPGTQPQEPGWVKLNTNELPYPPSPRVAAAVAVEADRLRLYPNPTAQPLRRALAAHHGLGEDHVIVGNGSDDILNLLARAYSGPGYAIAQTSPSYSLYPVLAAVQQAPVLSVEFAADFRLPVEDLAAQAANLLFLTSPNAPAGVAFPLADIGRLAASFPGLLVVDEAYVDFAQETAVELLPRYRNLVVTRTFSKSYGLAGLRVGYALAHPEVIAVLDKVRESYNLDRLAQAGALAALEDQDYLREVVGRIRSTREAFQIRLRERGWFAYPSQTNFILARPATSSGRSGPEVAADCFRFLQTRKVLVRYFPAHVLTAPCLRLTVGTDAEMATLNDALDAWQATAK